jgi:3-oxoacyl-[acyl-carrier-protein] synthase II
MRKNPDPVYVTGMGIISAIGHSVEESFRSLSQAKSGITPLHYLQTIHQADFVAGEVKLSNAELAERAGTGNYNRTSLLALIAAQEALSDAGISNMHEARTGFISSTTVGSMCYAESHYKAFFEGENDTDFIESYLIGIGHDDLAKVLGIRDYVTTISTACSSSANAIMLGARLIRHKILDRVVVGGVDALSKFTLNGFNTLMLLDREPCKPFDEERKGLNLGEGAAYLVLESEKLVLEQQKKIWGRIIGYSNANDAYHPTASSPNGEGALLAMQQAFAVAGIAPSLIDYINAHGTGTENNDLSEGMAMQQMFSAGVPKFSSTKAYTGHTLAAAAAIEAVISLLGMKENMIFPGLNRRIPMKELRISPVDVLEKNAGLNHVMSNSFGFGGNCSSLIFAKH